MGFPAHTLHPVQDTTHLEGNGLSFPGPLLFKPAETRSHLTCRDQAGATAARLPWRRPLLPPPRRASPWTFGAYLSPLDLAAPHPQQRALPPPASPVCAEKGGEAQKGKEKARGCCSCRCWAPESGLRLQSLSGQALVPCGHLGHPKSREETKPQQSKKPFQQGKGAAGTAPTGSSCLGCWSPTEGRLPPQGARQPSAKQQDRDPS